MANSFFSSKRIPVSYNGQGMKEFLGKIPFVSKLIDGFILTGGVTVAKLGFDEGPAIQPERFFDMAKEANGIFFGIVEEGDFQIYIGFFEKKGK